MSSFEINPYDKKLHGAARKAFNCGVPPLNQYFLAQMGQDLKTSYITCFVASDGQGAVIGYYTLSMASFSLDDLTKEQQKALATRQYKDVPAALVGRLAVDLRFKGQGYGPVLLADAIARVKGSGVGTFAVIVEAKDDKAKAFYEHHGFMPFPSNPLKLFLPLSNVDPNA